VYVKPTESRTIGGTVEDGIKLYRESFAKSWPVALGAQLVLALPAALAQYQSRDLPAAGGAPQAMLAVLISPAIWLPFLAGFAVYAGFYNALIVQLEGTAAGVNVSRGDSLAAGFRLLPRTILLSIVMLAVFIVAAGSVALAGSVLDALSSPLLLVVLIFVPAVILIYVWGKLFLANVALVVEDAQVFKALDISWTLLKSHWWRAGAVYSIAWIPMIALYVIVAVMDAVLIVATSRSPLGMGSAVSEAVSIVGGAVLMSFVPALLLALYHDLKLRRPGTASQAG
jgi:hypothetical protein